MFAKWTKEKLDIDYALIYRKLFYGKNWRISVDCYKKIKFFIDIKSRWNFKIRIVIKMEAHERQPRYMPKCVSVKISLAILSVLLGVMGFAVFGCVLHNWNAGND